jgi:hypothetical protein
MNPNCKESGTMMQQDYFTDKVLVQILSQNDVSAMNENA